ELSSAPVGDAPQLPAHLFEDSVPLAGARLTKEACTRIPGVVGALQHPTPVGHVSQRDPYRSSQCTAEVCHRRVAGDDELDTLHDGGRIEECIWPTVEIIPQTLHAHARR